MPFSKHEEDEDVKGHAFSEPLSAPLSAANQDEDDVKGHAPASDPASAPVSAANEEEDDVEGHSMNAPFSAPLS